MLDIGSARDGLRKALFTALLGLALAVPGFAWAEGPSPRIVTFGDSVSDSGNAFALQGTNNVPPSYDLDALLVPSAAYARGGHHLSNGATWIEVLARSMGFPADAGPAFRSEDPRAANYAVAGARAYNDGINANLALQIGAFLMDFDGVAPPDALYVVEIGGSDVRDFLSLGAPLAVGPQVIAGGIEALYQAGARKFLVLNVANIGLLPSVQFLEPVVPGIGALATAKTLEFNADVETRLQALEAIHADLQILRFDLFDAIDQIHSSPGDFGLTQVNLPCVMPDTPPFACTNPDEYLFWDGIHPTKVVHAIVAGQVEALLTP